MMEMIRSAADRDNKLALDTKLTFMKCSRT